MPTTFPGSPSRVATPAVVVATAGLAVLVGNPSPATAAGGASVPFRTVEAECSATNGTAVGPDHTQATIASEASGRQAVRLGQGRYVEFTLPAAANSINVHYNLPDGNAGRMSLYVNGTKLSLPATSRYSYVDTGWVPGARPHGVNFDGAVTNSTIRNNYLRNNGDDGLALWSNGQAGAGITIANNTVVQPNLANGIAVYGGANNTGSGNLVRDTNALGGGILVANRFNSVPLPVRPEHRQHRVGVLRYDHNAVRPADVHRQHRLARRPGVGVRGRARVTPNQLVSTFVSSN